MRFVLGALCALLLCAGAAVAQPADTGSPALEASRPAETVVLSQGDARWKDIRLGNGTVGSQGCLVMSLAMILMEQGLMYDPRELISLFIRTGMVDRRGRLYTSALPLLFPALKILDRRPAAKSNVEDVSAWLAKGAFVLLKLDPEGRSQQHWVRAAKVANDDIVVVDPAGGRIGSLDQLYGTKTVKEVMVLGTK